jgi:hypothetical protein
VDLSEVQRGVLGRIEQKFEIGQEFRRFEIFGKGRAMTAVERNALYKLQALGIIKSTNQEHGGTLGWYRRMK